MRINFIVAREAATISSCCGEGVQVRREREGGEVALIFLSFRVMSAVKDFNVPVPALLSLCEDDRLASSQSHPFPLLFYRVVGTPFYLMEYIKGRIFKDASLPSLKPNERAVRQSSLRSP